MSNQHKRKGQRRRDRNLRAGGEKTTDKYSATSSQSIWRASTFELEPAASRTIRAVTGVLENTEKYKVWKS